jgi:hypothetical protein
MMLNIRDQLNIVLTGSVFSKVGPVKSWIGPVKKLALDHPVQFVKKTFVEPWYKIKKGKAYLFQIQSTPNLNLYFVKQTNLTSGRLATPSSRPDGLRIIIHLSY